MPIISSLSDGSSAQRGGLNHQAIEDYLKTIYKLAKEASPVSTSRLAKARDVKPASATGMIRRLSSLGLAHYEKHRGVTLSAEGERIALEVIRHHRLIELYLIRALGFGIDEVHEQADLLEHVISEQLEERIAIALGYPKFDPHGSPIPLKDGIERPVLTNRLSTYIVGQQGVVAKRIKDSYAEYCDERMIHVGTDLTVLEKEPYDGTILVNINQTNQLISFRVAQTIVMESVSDKPST